MFGRARVLLLGSHQCVLPHKVSQNWSRGPNWKLFRHLLNEKNVLLMTGHVSDKEWPKKNLNYFNFSSFFGDFCLKTRVIGKESKKTDEKGRERACILSLLLTRLMYFRATVYCTVPQTIIGLNSLITFKTW